jgi:hypothetical protein
MFLYSGEMDFIVNPAVVQSQQMDQGLSVTSISTQYDIGIKIFFFVSLILRLVRDFLRLTMEPLVLLLACRLLLTAITMGLVWN